MLRWSTADFSQPVSQDMSLQTGPLARVRIRDRPKRDPDVERYAARHAKPERSADRSGPSARPDSRATAQSRGWGERRDRDPTRLALVAATRRVRFRDPGKR